MCGCVRDFVWMEETKTGRVGVRARGREGRSGLDGLGRRWAAGGLGNFILIYFLLFF
jgi:hypothetical protein